MSGESEFLVTLVAHATAEIVVPAVDAEHAAARAVEIAKMIRLTGHSRIVMSYEPADWRVDETRALPPLTPEATVHVDDLAGYARMRQRAIEQGDTF